MTKGERSNEPQTGPTSRGRPRTTAFQWTEKPPNQPGSRKWGWEDQVARSISPNGLRAAFVGATWCPNRLGDPKEAVPTFGLITAFFFFFFFGTASFTTPFPLSPKSPLASDLLLPWLRRPGRDPPPGLSVCFCLFNFRMKITRKRETPAARDKSVSRYTLSAQVKLEHGWSRCTGRERRPRAPTAAPSGSFPPLLTFVVFTSADLTHTQSHRTHWRPLCLLERSSTPRRCHLCPGSCGRDFHSEYSRYGRTCQRSHWPSICHQD